MKTNSTQQEILLVTSSTLSKQQLCSRNDFDNKPSSSHPDQLEEACWNGLLEELLPEIIQKATTGKSLYVWHIRNGKSFLQVALSELPMEMEKSLSINTDFFLSSMPEN